MLRKFLFGSLWLVVFTCLTMIVLAFTLYAVLPHDAAGDLTSDGNKTVQHISGAIMPFIVGGLIGLVVIASKRGWLPGTRSKPPVERLHKTIVSGDPAI